MSVIIHKRFGHGVLVVNARGLEGSVMPLGVLEAADSQLAPPEEHIPWYWVARVKVAPKHRNSGVGSLIMRAANELADYNGIVMYLVPNPYDSSISYDRLVEFYDRFGFTERFHMNDGIVHVRRPR